MPVVDSVLEEKNKIVSDELALISKKHGALKVIQSNIKSITMIQDPEFSRDNTKKILPDDNHIGGKMASARRQKTFDKILSDLTTLGL